MFEPKPPLREAIAARLGRPKPPAPPPQPAAPQPEHGGKPSRPGRRGLGLAAWVRKKPTERVPLPVGAVLYAAGWVSHVVQPPTVGMLMGTLAGGAVTYLWRVRRIGDEARAGMAAGAVAGAGAWLSVCSQVSPSWGPSWTLSWTFLAGFGVAYWIYRSAPVTRQKIEWRETKTGWHVLAARYGLRGAHLLRAEDTRLGEKVLLDVTGTGQRASAIAKSDLAERIAEDNGLPASRVKVWADRIAGRVWISIRWVDPWAQPIIHPVLDDDPEIVLPEVADVRKPLIIGIDPETGKPLELIVYNEDGAQQTLIVAKTGGGKTTVLNNIMERLTAAPNCLVLGINVSSKAKEMRRWRKAIGLSACTRAERVRALRILEFAESVIDLRGGSDSDDAVHIPTETDPYIAVVIDEMDDLVDLHDNIAQATRAALKRLVGKGRSEAVGVIMAGTRAIAEYVGGNNIRTQFDNIILLKLNRQSEAAHAVGESGIDLPDMANYGEGHPGVTLVYRVGGTWHAGRSFYLRDLPDIDAVVAGRAKTRLTPASVAGWHPSFSTLMATEHGVDAAWIPANPVEDTPAEAPAPTPPDIEEPPMGEQPEQIRKALETIQRTSEYLAQVPELPELDADQAAAMAAAAAERRDEAAHEVEVPDKAREVLMGLLAEGTTVRRAAEALEPYGVPRMGAWRLLDRLRVDGVAVMRGKGRGASWHLAEPGDRDEEEDGDEHAA